MRKTQTMAAALVATSLVVFGAVASPAAASVVVGTAAPSLGNCYPFSCGYAGTYQQVYSSSAFSGPVSIGSIDFFTTQRPGTLNTANYTLTFYYTNQAVDGLSSTFATNRGSLLSNFGTYSLTGAAPSTLDFAGSAFTYDPSLGNLLLDVSVSNITASGTSFQDVDFDSGDLSSRVYNPNSTTVGSPDSYGLVTRFNFSSAVPESSTWAMMLLGFGGIGVTARRRAKSRIAQVA